MTPFVIQAVNLIIKARQNISDPSSRYEVNFISLVSFFVYVLLILGIARLEERDDPCKKALLLVLKEVNSLVHVLVND